jgi:hypothetical protein
MEFVASDQTKRHACPAILRPRNRPGARCGGRERSISAFGNKTPELGLVPTKKPPLGRNQRRLYAYARRNLIEGCSAIGHNPYSREVKERFPLMRHPSSGYFGCDVWWAARALA